MNKITLAVIAATFNRKDYLRNLLLQVNRQKVQDNLQITTVVVDDGSSDGTSEMLRNEFPNVVVIKGSGNWWWTKSMNAGFKYAFDNGIEYVLILNDDIKIDDSYFQTLFNDYFSLGEVCVLGSVSVDMKPPHRILSSGSSSFNKLLLRPKPYHSIYAVKSANLFGVHPTYNLSGRGTLIPTSIFDKVGFYDNKLVQYGSDDEFILRARKKGLKSFISWNAVIYNDSKLTSYAAAHQKSSLVKFGKGILDIHSVNSIRKQSYLYMKYGCSVFLPFYLVYFLIGAFFAQYIKYNDFKNK